MRIEISVREGGEWRKVYESRAPEDAWLHPIFEKYRMRRVVYATAWDNPRHFKHLCDWIATQAARDFPNATEVMIRHLRYRTPTPAEAPKVEENCYHCEACALTCSPSQMVCCNCKRVLAGRVFKPAPAPAIGSWRVADFGEHRECFFPAMYPEAEVRRETGWVRNERNSTVRVLPTCKWTESDPWGNEPQTWETDCDNMFYFSESGPKENQMAFCCYCGKPLEEVPWKNEEQSDDED